LYTPEQYREHVALVASTYDHRPGRTWRPLQDTADAAQLLYFTGQDWENWRRGTDYYDEGELIWLEVDTRIRQLTDNKKSIDDFCKAFHGGPGGKPELKTYTFEDIVNGLNGVVANDWWTMLRTRLDSIDPHAPLGGIENGGWKLIYDERPNDIEVAEEAPSRHASFTSSIGLLLGDDGSVVDVVVGSAAYKTGMGPGMKISAVNGRQFSLDGMRDAIDTAKTSTEAIHLMVGNGPYLKSYDVDYHDGVKYPHLVRVDGKPDYLTDISAPHATH
jgi:predicted metalloprotease with PDZ domain